MGTLDGKAALVTGAGQGIGRGIALALAGEGAAVALMGRTISALDQVAAKIAERGGKAVPVVGDVTSDTDCDAAVAETLAQLGSLDLLVNNAQAFAFGTVADIDLADVEAGWQSGPMGTLRLMRAALPHLRHGGAVVNVSSGATSDGDGAGTGGYAAAKAAIEALSRAAAVEWAGDDVRVNVVIPFSKTPSVEAVLSAYEGVEDQVLSQVPMGRWGDAEREIGRAVAFLCGPDASFVTGTTLAVDGGSTYLR
ncbi:MAG: SDR family oxidoreductase [Actinomycetota bacterium]|nr:SDR family oxidoreductase [Actinomycetota bacterium]MDH5312841.1 SDR family oxidoreductase [Actinomycetota bacterium]